MCGSAGEQVHYIDHSRVRVCAFNKGESSGLPPPRSHSDGEGGKWLHQRLVGQNVFELWDNHLHIQGDRNELSNSHSSQIWLSSACLSPNYPSVLLANDPREADRVSKIVFRTGIFPHFCVSTMLPVWPESRQPSTPYFRSYTPT